MVMKISIVIPCYEMKGHGVEYLRRCLDSIRQQSFEDYDVIISDHSVDREIETMVFFEYGDRFSYYRTEYKRGVF